MDPEKFLNTVAIFQGFVAVLYALVVSYIIYKTPKGSKAKLSENPGKGNYVVSQSITLIKMARNGTPPLQFYLFCFFYVFASDSCFTSQRVVIGGKVEWERLETMGRRS